MSEALILGSCIARYRVVRELGHGGMGIVYEALHDEIGRRAAIKVLSPHYADDPRYVRRFFNEARMISRVRHPGLVQIYDFGQTPSGVLYILMELLEGETLRSRLARLAHKGTLLSETESSRVVRQIAAALRATHEEGIVHRDLKPANVMIVADDEAPGGERVKLLDFGIAQFVESQEIPLTAPGRALGTVTYMSPEQCVGDDGVGPSADVYSLGVMLHELLTGSPPFSGATSSEVMRKHLLAEPPLLPETLPPGLVSLAARMLAKAPTLRPSMRDVMQLLASDKCSDVAEVRGSFDLSVTETAEVCHTPSRSYPGAHSPSTDTEYLDQRRGDGEEVVEALGTRTLPPAVRNQLASTRIDKQRAKRTGSRIMFGLLCALMLVWKSGDVMVNSSLPQQDESHPPGMGIVPETPSPMKHPIEAGSTSPAPQHVAVKSSLPQEVKSCPAGMVLVPGGAFEMGSPDGTGAPDQFPQHIATLSAYCIDKTEVTAKAYESCVAVRGCTMALSVRGPKQEWNRYCNGSDRPDHPINCVDWNQAAAYCAWAGKRLPTEAEWEYAARGSDDRRYPWGNQPPSAELLNACGTECLAGVQNPDRSAGLEVMYHADDGWVSTAPVGSFPAGASPFGVLDMAGNVYEWTADWYGIYSSRPVSNPQGPKNGTYRVTRGGGWLSSAPDGEIRATSRIADSPSMRRVRLGFRCAQGGGKDGE